jgi:hypothetical protein
MDASDSPVNPSHWLTRRIDSSHIFWLLSPLGFPIVYWLAPRLPAGVGIFAGVVMLFLLPGWLMHMLLVPGATVGLASRISRAFVLSISLCSFLGLMAWFFGGDAGLGPVTGQLEQSVPFPGRLTTVLWAEAICLLAGGVLLVVRSARMAKAADGSGPDDAASIDGQIDSTGKRNPSQGLTAAQRSHSGGGESDAMSRSVRPAETRPFSPGGFSGETDNPVMQRIFREAYRLGDQHKLDHPVAPRWATLMVLGVMVLAASLLCFYNTGILGLFTDAPDHIACIGEMVDQDRILPRTTFYLDGDGASVDARKGFFHVMLAMLATLTRNDPIDLWRLLPGMLVPFVLIVFHNFARQLLRSEGTALFATFLALICYGEAVTGLFIRIAYGSRMGEILVWAVLSIALAQILRTPNRRVMWMLGIATFGATAVHVFSGVMVLFTLGIYFLALLVFRGVRHRAWHRAGSCLLVCSAGAAIPILWRVVFAMKALNPIHTHRQGILSFSDNLFIIDPGEWSRLLLGIGFGGIFLSLFLWRRAREDDSAVYLVSLSLVPLLIVANPLVVPLIEPYLGYLVTRFILAVPFFLVLAGMARLMSENLLELNSARRVVAALAFYVFMVVLLFPRLQGFAASYSVEKAERMRGNSILVWEELLVALTDKIPEPAVILSDPLTSYSIPAFTRHRVVSVLHQHSSPSDSLALIRYAACRDVLSPYLGAAEKARLCRRFGVDYVVVNGFLGRYDKFNLNTGPELALKQRTALDQEVALFERIALGDLDQQCAMYRVRKENLDGLVGIMAAGEQRLLGSTTESLTRDILCRELPRHARPVLSDTTAGITLVAVSFDSTWTSRGDPLGMTLYWRRVGDAPRFQVSALLRVDHPSPRDKWWRFTLSKVHRRIQQYKRGIQYRFDRRYTPLDGMLGIEHWPMDQIVVDRTRLRVRDRGAVGEYDLKVSWAEQSLLPNLNVFDHLCDADRYDGPIIGVLEVY